MIMQIVLNHEDIIEACRQYIKAQSGGTVTQGTFDMQMAGETVNLGGTFTLESLISQEISELPSSKRTSTRKRKATTASKSKSAAQLGKDTSTLDATKNDDTVKKESELTQEDPAAEKPNSSMNSSKETVDALPQKPSSKQLDETTITPEDLQQTSPSCMVDGAIVAEETSTKPSETEPQQCKSIETPPPENSGSETAKEEKSESTQQATLFSTGSGGKETTPDATSEMKMTSPLFTT